MADAILSAPAIYAIKNLVNGKLYVGSATNLRRRWATHLSFLRRGIHHGVLLQRAWNKYGEAAFRLEVIEEVADCSTLIQREQYWIDFHNAAKAGYNTCPIAGSTAGKRHTKEARENMSHSKKLLCQTEEMRRVLSERSKAVAQRPGVRERMSAAAKKQWADPEFREFKSRQSKELASVPERKERQSKLIKERWSDPEMRAKWCAAMKGRKSGKGYSILLFGVHYESLVAAATAHGRNRDWVKKRMIRIDGERVPKGSQLSLGF